MAQGRQEGRRGRRAIEASLSAADTYRLGDPIDVTYSLTNTGTRPYQVLVWETPLEAEVTDFLTLERDGERIRYDGRRVKRGDPVDDDYVLLAPGERVDRTVDISRSYPIQATGVYTATLKSAVMDAFPVTTDAKRPPRLRAQHDAQPLDPVQVTFTVVPGAQPKQTDGQAVRAAEQGAGGAQQAKAKAKDPSFNGGTATEQADTRIAHANAQHWAAQSRLQLQTTTGGSNTLYSDWFGAFDQGRYDTVTDNYKKIDDLLENETVTYDHTGSGCGASWYAYTYPGSKTTWLCSSYLSAPQIGTDCKFGTLIHEWSHAVAGTDDHAYGETAAGNLASNTPSLAIDNADNHEYFAEHLAQSDFAKALTFITDRSQFGRDEVDALLASSNPAAVEKAFYVHADGYWPDKLGITAGSLGASPNVKPTLSMNPSVAGMSIEVTSLEAEDPSLPIAPQRFTWVIRAKFTGSGGFPNVPNTQQLVTLTATLAGLSASAQIRLVKEASPYELDGPVSWLSTDVRVFQIAAGQSRFGATIGSTPAAASTFIQQVVGNLNAGSSGGQTFDGISTDQQQSALELSQQVNGTNIFNFAVAKVRYVGTVAVSNVRAFFRLFPVSSTSTEFSTGTTYRRDTQGSKVIPLLGVSGGGDLLTIPCFAEARVNSATTSLTSQSDPTNVRATMAASPPAGETVAYFGAWLDINQTTPQFPPSPSPANGPWSSGRKSIQELVKNAHQCLVAEIAYDPDEISAGAGPGGSDKLAQRNLSIVTSANPGDPASRRIANVFELWPAATIKVPDPAPDEILIDWGNVPAGTNATVYIPEVTADQFVTLAGRPNGRAAIQQVDGETISVPTGGISYVPIPPGAAFGLTGLLTIDLPETVKKGEAYTIVVRQVTDAMPARVFEPPGIAKAAAGAKAAGAADLLRWRQIVGSYQITVPVRTKDVMLVPEMRLLSVLRWNLEQMSTSERWYRVFSRYVGTIEDRVRGLGGDPEGVEGSPAGLPGDRGEEPDGRPDGRPCEPFDRGPTCRYDGKVVGLLYDCFGDFEGFLLDDCGREIRFVARERQIEELIDRAWRERIAITVVVREAAKRRPVEIILRRRP